MSPKHTHTGHVLCLRLLLGEDPEDKVSLFVGLEGGGDDQVLPGGQAQARAHLPQVDEGLGARTRRMAQKEIFLQVDILAASELAGAEDTKMQSQNKICPLAHTNMEAPQAVIELINGVVTSSGICIKKR